MESIDFLEESSKSCLDIILLTIGNDNPKQLWAEQMLLDRQTTSFFFAHVSSANCLNNTIVSMLIIVFTLLLSFLTLSKASFPFENQYITRNIMTPQQTTSTTIPTDQHQQLDDQYEHNGLTTNPFNLYHPPPPSKTHEEGQPDEEEEAVGDEVKHNEEGKLGEINEEKGQQQSEGTAALQQIATDNEMVSEFTNSAESQQQNEASTPNLLTRLVTYMLDLLNIKHPDSPSLKSPADPSAQSKPKNNPVNHLKHLKYNYHPSSSTSAPNSKTHKKLMFIATVWLVGGFAMLWVRWIKSQERKHIRKGVKVPTYEQELEKL